MTRYNIGDFRYRITLMKPVMDRDTMGGMATRYEDAGTIFARIRAGSSNNAANSISQRNDTIYGVNTYATLKMVVIRDISTKYPINENWRVKYQGVVYTIDGIERDTDYPPYYIRFRMQSISEFK